MADQTSPFAARPIAGFDPTKLFANYMLDWYRPFPPEGTLPPMDQENRVSAFYGIAALTGLANVIDSEGTRPVEDLMVELLSALRHTADLYGFDHESLDEEAREIYGLNLEGRRE